jgi:hypothetical protein
MMSRSNSGNILALYQSQPTTTTTGTDTDTETKSIDSESAALIYPSRDGSRPGFAPEQTLSRGLQIPSKSYRLTSGFEYPAALSTYDVSQEDWTRFTHEITENAKLSSSQWKTVIGVGIGTMTVGGMMIGVFGAIPAIIAARRKRANQESRNLAKAMGLSPSSSSPTKSQEDLGEEREESGNSLSYRINQWNETFFKPRWLLIRIGMPYEMSAVEDGLYVVKQFPSLSPVSLRQVSVSSISAENETRQKERLKASHRCRIVVIPLNRGPKSVMSQETSLAVESPYIPAVYE